MKDFFKMFGASLAALCVWGIISTLFGFLFFVVMISAILGGDDSSTKTDKIKEVSVLKLQLGKSIGERSVTDYSVFYTSNALSLENAEKLGLNDIAKALDYAANDDCIAALCVDCSDYNVPDLATGEAIRNMIIDFRNKSGKPAYAFSHDYSNQDYYIATACDSVYMRTFGDFMLRGLCSQVMFLKSALDKFGLEAQVIRHGKFKAAVEPYLQDKMSEANRLQISTYLNDFWQDMLSGISESRGISCDDINNNASSLALYSNNNLCIDQHYLDGILLESEFDSKMAEVAGTDEVNYVSVSEYCKTLTSSEFGSAKVAVIYAVGEIQADDQYGEEVITSKNIVKAIKEARDDEDVKAVVLRINSPGGSATEAEIIYQELLKLKEEKPIVVSMGGYAASGGYYIASPANKIFAENTTVTGSIGVFGLMINPQKLLNNTLGITVEEVSTNKNASLESPYTSKTSEQVSLLQRSVENVYTTFISHVAEGRNMSMAAVDSIAQGRVWTGKSALKLGLVDEIGGLDDAIMLAAQLADIESYNIQEFPQKEDDFSKLFSGFFETSMSLLCGKEIYQQKRFVEKIKTHTGIQVYQPIFPIE